MQLVGERQTPDNPATLASLIAGQATTTDATSSTPDLKSGPMQWTVTRPNPDADRAQWKATVLATLNVLFVILAVRAVLLVAVIGALVLARAALEAPAAVQQPALVMLAVYCITVVVPMVWLSSRR